MRSKQPNRFTPGARKLPDHGQRSERKVAKKLGARMTPASGAIRGRKGDSTMEATKTRPPLMVESKATVHDSMGVQLDWLVKVSQEAVDVGKMPALTVSFVTGDGQPRRFGEWVLVPAHVFREFIADLP